MKSQPVHTVYKSECCTADLISIPEIIIKTEYGRGYYHEKCAACDKPCRTKLTEFIDSAGTKVVAGELLYCPDNGLWEYHAVYIEEGELTIRDLNANNNGTWSDPCFGVGPWWLHLDKLTDEDIEFYFNANREAGLKMLARYK